MSADELMSSIARAARADPGNPSLEGQILGSFWRVVPANSILLIEVNHEIQANPSPEKIADEMAKSLSNDFPGLVLVIPRGFASVRSMSKDELIGFFKGLGFKLVEDEQEGS